MQHKPTSRYEGAVIEGMSLASMPQDRPPEHLRSVFKRYKTLDLEDISKDSWLLDFNDRSGLWQKDPHISRNSISKDQIRSIIERFQIQPPSPPDTWENRFSYKFDTIPGLEIVPALLTSSCQRDLLSRLLHRDLSDSRHCTNVHLHHHVPYPAPSYSARATAANSAHGSFFSHDTSEDLVFSPKSSELHKSFGISHFLNKKLRWITLGGQYDWTRKVYPKEKPPDFPRDIADLVQGFFPDMTPEAAIVNLYSPGDTLSLHRDVSEDCDRGLVSISLGCDAIFVIGLDGHQSEALEMRGEERDSRYLVVRLHSGDALYMSGAARHAWHGVPRILADTCPSWLKDWPAASDEYGADKEEYRRWRGWMANKRINLNVRQMYEVVDGG